MYSFFNCDFKPVNRDLFTVDPSGCIQLSHFQNKKSSVEGQGLLVKTAEGPMKNLSILKKLH